MQVCKRRVVALVAAGMGGAGLLMSSAGAQTTPPTSVPSIPDFSIPDFSIPDFTIPTPPTTTTSPPPTMPPSTTTSTSPPPTMPPTSITVPDITIPDEARELIEDVISQLEQLGDDFSQIVDDLRGLLDLF